MHRAPDMNLTRRQFVKRGALYVPPLFFIPKWSKAQWAAVLAGSSGIAYDTDAAAYFARIVTNGGTIGATAKGIANTWFLAAKANGYFTKILRCGLIIGDQLIAAQTPAIVGGGSDPDTNHNFVGIGTDYAETGASAGLKCDGSTKYLDTGWNPSTQSLSTSSAGLFSYVKGTESAGTTRTIIGITDGTNLSLLGWMNGGSQEAGRLADATGGPSPTAQASVQGFLGVTCSGSRVQTYYKDGSAVGTPTTANGTFASRPFFVGALNSSGTAATFSTRYIRAYFVTTGLSATDAANLNTDIQAFQTSLTRNV